MHPCSCAALNHHRRQQISLIQLPNRLPTGRGDSTSPSHYMRQPSFHSLSSSGTISDREVQIEEEIQWHREQICRLMAEHNPTSRISRLPAEILCHIFYLYARSSAESQPQELTKLLLVCRACQARACEGHHVLWDVILVYLPANGAHLILASIHLMTGFLDLGTLS
ncbi:hypothetical protein C8J57DRAFT_1213163 [Mycena rebaudengoi]|nr:hypothetical protein C8J57DRAFT_1213163 [Mycena rebaudengoi]